MNDGQTVGYYCQCLVHGKRNRDFPEISDQMNFVLNKDSEELSIVAEHVCHPPEPFFEYIGIQHNHMYQMSCNKKTKKKTEKEYILDCLKRWTECGQQGKEADLRTLVNGLWEADFHHINDLILKKHNNNNNNNSTLYPECDPE